MNVIQRLLHRPFFIRLLHWEYWSFSAVYTCIYPIWIVLSLRARSFFFFAAANPRIKNGGYLNESKKDIVTLIPERYHPRTVFFDLPTNAERVLLALQQEGLSYPLIGKPNVGGRGRGVKVLKSDEDVYAYAKRSAMDFHIQEFVRFKKEAGIFYYRYPGQERGVVTGIVRKEFLSVKGDGQRTIRQLLQQDKRAIMILSSLETIHGPALEKVLPEGAEQIVSPYGNHARGSKFLDDSHLIDEELTLFIDSICKEIPDFYFGRLDIRYESWDALKKGQHFAIIEVNGAGSEPTHMYDPKHSLFFAWKEIIRHWIILWRISRMNHRLGHRYLTLKEGLQMFREDREWSQKLQAMTD